MSRFCIAIAAYGRRPHAACFEDVAKAMAESLRRLGHEVFSGTIRPGQDHGRMIMFGCNNGEWLSAIPEDAIIFNSEQLAAVDDPERYFQNHNVYRKGNHVIWDYSAANVEVLKQFGLRRVVHCPIGYVDTMTTIQPAPVEDVDVLFYGSTNPHRDKVLNALEEEGLAVAKLFGVYGAERDKWISRAKVVLNMHHYERGVFEIFRVSHLVANKKLVVSEAGGCDAELETIASRITMSVPYERLVDACVKLVQSSDATRHSLADGAHAVFRQMNFVEYVKRALEQSEV